MLVPRLSDVVIATIYDGIEAAARSAGYREVVSNTNDEPADQQALAQVMLDHRVDGLIIGDADVDDQFVSELERREVRFVLVNRRSGSHVAATCDDLPVVSWWRNTCTCRGTGVSRSSPAIRVPAPA